MGHVVLNGVYDWQQGPRGDEQVFVSGMAMGIGPARPRRRHAPAAGDGEPRSAERAGAAIRSTSPPARARTASTPLVDRQHPHDFFMELSASYSRDIGSDASLFVYAGLPGEPAFGPPAFMHRVSIMDLPEAPITHHWLDSTHITFGVVTAGLIVGDLKLEGSRFNGREPDHRRWNIETGPLDSTALRLSWNPNRHLVAAGELGAADRPRAARAATRIRTRWSASAIYTRRFRHVHALVGDPGLGQSRRRRSLRARRRRRLRRLDDLRPRRDRRE